MRILSKRSEEKLWEIFPLGVVCSSSCVITSLITTLLPPLVSPLCVQVSAVRVRVPAACGGPEVSTDLPLRGKTPRRSEPFAPRSVGGARTPRIPSKGCSDPHSLRPGSVATNGISLSTGGAELAGQQLFIISVAFTGSRGGGGGSAPLRPLLTSPANITPLNPLPFSTQPAFFFYLHFFFF